MHKLTNIPCLFCGTVIHNLDPNANVINSTPWKGGLVTTAVAASGSELEGDTFVFGVCDKCLKSTPSRIIHIKGNHTQLQYFHELTQEEVEALMDSGISLMLLNRIYQQPAWCGMKKALNYSSGCPILMDTAPDGGRANMSKENCAKCMYYLK